MPSVSRRRKFSKITTRNRHGRRVRRGRFFCHRSIGPFGYRAHNFGRFRRNRRIKYQPTTVCHTKHIRTQENNGGPRTNCRDFAGHSCHRIGHFFRCRHPAPHASRLCHRCHRHNRVQNCTLRMVQTKLHTLYIINGRGTQNRPGPG